MGSAWNLPILSLTWKAAPALMCGNTIISKPAQADTGGNVASRARTRAQRHADSDSSH